MIWSTSYHHVTLLVHRSWPHLLFTVASVHRRQVLLKLHRPTVHRSKASDLPFTLATGPSSQTSSWSSPPWSHDSMPCLICNELLHDTITCRLIPCVSHINTISPPKIVTQLLKPNKDLSKVDNRIILKIWGWKCTLHLKNDTRCFLILWQDWTHIWLTQMAPHMLLTEMVLIRAGNRQIHPSFRMKSAWERDVLVVHIDRCVMCDSAETETLLELSCACASAWELHWTRCHYLR
jgi:hypothetical protein